MSNLIKVPKIKTETVQIINLQEFNRVVSATYGRPYDFQQQDGCRERGHHKVTVPTEGYDYENDTLPYTYKSRLFGLVINNAISSTREMGVSFAAWLARKPDVDRTLWWDRNFYPHLDMILNDLHGKGIIDEGEYMIAIDW